MYADYTSTLAVFRDYSGPMPGLSANITLNTTILWHRDNQFTQLMKHKQTLFQRQCYQLLERIPEGKVTTYREIARALGSKAWRAVGTAMAQNQRLVTVPCHRVVRSDGTLGQYALGADKKAQLLRHEGVIVDKGKVDNLEAYLHRF